MNDKAVSWCEEKSLGKTVSCQMLMSNVLRLCEPVTAVQLWACPKMAV